VVPRLDPGRANYARFAGAYNTIRLVIGAVFAAIYALLHAAYRHVPLDVTRGILIVIGAEFVALGNVLGKVRPNWFVGVRTPWTLSSKESWVKSHRLAGWVFVFGGALMLAAGLSGAQWLQIAALVGFFGGLIGAVVYSYVVWKRDPDKVPPAGTTPAENG